MEDRQGRCLIRALDIPGVCWGKDPALPIGEVRGFGRQILEGLSYLLEKGIPYGQLHTGNVLLTAEGRCALTDVENGILGTPALYSSFIGSLPALKTIEHHDVYSFGHVMYEMATGAPLGAPICTPSMVQPGIPGAAIISSVLSEEAVGLPRSVSSLIKDGFFSSSPGLPPGSKTSFKTSARVRDALTLACKGIETRMQAQQHVIEQARRQARISEEKRQKEVQKELERQRIVKT